MHVDLSRKDLEHGRERKEVFGESKDGSTGTTLGKFWPSAGVLMSYTFVDVPWTKRGTKAIQMTSQIETIHRLIHEKTGAKL